MASNMANSEEIQETIMNRVFRQCYGAFIVHPLTQIGVVLLFLAYMAGAIYGLTLLREGLNPAKLVMPGHMLQRWVDRLESTFLKEANTMHFYVFNPPNISDPVHYNNTLAMIADFEAYKRAWGKESTVFFMQDWLDYMHRDGYDPFTDLTSDKFFEKLKRYCTLYSESTALWSRMTDWQRWNSTQGFGDKVYAGYVSDVAENFGWKKDLAVIASTFEKNNF